MALGETSGTLRMGFLDYETDNNFGALCSSTTHPEWAVGEEIEIVTLDAFLSSRKLRPHFIKIDVQNLRAVRFARSAANPAGLPAHPVY
jgi:hypothetical protein